MTNTDVIDYLTLTPQGGIVSIPAIIAIGNDNHSWSFHTPKPNGIKAIKLTPGNLQGVAATLLKLGEPVTLNDTTIVLSRSELVLQTGDWLVEEWDYEEGFNTYRIAELDERVRYDLR